jgi:hypothetical protein
MTSAVINAVVVNNNPKKIYNSPRIPPIRIAHFGRHQRSDGFHGFHGSQSTEDPIFGSRSTALYFQWIPIDGGLESMESDFLEHCSNHHIFPSFRVPTPTGPILPCGIEWSQQVFDIFRGLGGMTSASPCFGGPYTLPSKFTCVSNAVITQIILPRNGYQSQGGKIAY